MPINLSLSNLKKSTQFLAFFNNAYCYPLSDSRTPSFKNFKAAFPLSMINWESKE